MHVLAYLTCTFHIVSSSIIQQKLSYTTHSLIMLCFRTWTTPLTGSPTSYFVMKQAANYSLFKLINFSIIWIYMYHCSLSITNHISKTLTFHNTYWYVNEHGTSILYALLKLTLIIVK